MTKMLMCVAAIALLATPVRAGQLHDAVNAGDAAKVKELIERGEDINEDDPRLGTPLHQAAMGGSREIVELLIAEGANLEAVNYRWGTPLEAAALKGNELVAAILIAKGADVQASDERGITPLHAAAEGGHAAIVQLLIENGADVNARSHAQGHRPGYTPVISAGQFDHFDIVDLLRAYGASTGPIETAVGLLASADPDAGSKIFEKYCIGCHNAGDGGGRLGPTLWGVLGREKASIADFKYSKALERLTGTWTFAEIDAFIASPLDYVPGAAMRIEGVRDPSQRADLIAFLRQRSSDPIQLPLR